MEAKQQELEYYIYITTNMLNGMQYLGQHTHKVGTKDSYLGSGVRLTNAIKKHKKENFHKEILYYAFDENELNEIEVWYIKHLDAVNDPNFYNLHCGGNVQHGKNNAAYGKNDKAVRCVETGEIYKSSKIAADSFGISESNISACCRGKQLTAANYHWERVNEKSIQKESIQKKRIICLNNNKTYNSIVEAAKELNLDAIHIGRVCKGKNIQTRGYKFKYLDKLTT